MSYEDSVYVGPYIILENKQYQVSEKHLVCDNGCDVLHISKFCHECGAELKKETVSITTESKFNHIINEEYHNIIFSPEYINGDSNEYYREILIPNNKCKRKYKSFGGVYEIKPKQINTDIIKFKEEYKHILEYIENHELVNKLEIKFGVVQYSY